MHYDVLPPIVFHAGGFRYRLWGCKPGTEYPVAKLLELKPRREELLSGKNPVGVLIVAHLDAMETERNLANRLTRRLSIARTLYGRFERDTVEDLLRLTDWLMALPEPEQHQFDAELEQIEREEEMPYVASWERRATARGKEEGRQEGLVELVIEQLETKFGPLDESFHRRISKMTDSQIKELGRKLLTAGSLDELGL